MFTWPYFDLSQVWSFSFLFEGHWVAWIWNAIWTWMFKGGTDLALTYFCWPFSWIAIFILLCIAVMLTCTIWLSAWAINYIVWKFLICLCCMTLWNLAAWICIAFWNVLVWLWPLFILFLKAFMLPVLAAAVLSELRKSKDWKKWVFYVLCPVFLLGLFFLFPLNWATWFFIITAIYLWIFMVEQDFTIQLAI